jgi:hypothetical protein
MKCCPGGGPRPPNGCWCSCLGATCFEASRLLATPDSGGLPYNACHDQSQGARADVDDGEVVESAQIEALAAAVAAHNCDESSTCGYYWRLRPLLLRLLIRPRASSSVAVACIQYTVEQPKYERGELPELHKPRGSNWCVFARCCSGSSLARCMSQALTMYTRPRGGTSLLCMFAASSHSDRKCKLNCNAEIDRTP